MGRHGRQGGARLVALLTIPFFLVVAFLGYDLFSSLPPSPAPPMAWASNLAFQGLAPDELAFTHAEKKRINACCERYARLFPSITLTVQRKRSWGARMDPGTELAATMTLMTGDGLEVIAPDRDVRRKELALLITRSVDKAADAVATSDGDTRTKGAKRIFF